MNSRFFKIAGLGFIYSSFCFGLTCPNKTNIPLCPNSGATLLDETYPTQAFVISNSPMVKGVQSAKVTSQYISKIAKSYNFEKMPQVFVPVQNADDFEKIISSIKSELEKNKVNPDKIKSILAQVSHIPSRNYTWQQDYFESFVDLKTGAPVLREIESYLDNRPITKGAVEKMQTAGGECSVSQGKSLKTALSTYADDASLVKDASFGSGEMGGNIEGAPGGFCLIGDNQAKKFAKQFCGADENMIQLQTSWLAVGHVDEIFKIVPSTFNDGRPKECQFSLMAASPKKALDLMGDPVSKGKPFYSFSPVLTEAEAKEVKRSRSNTTITFGNALICDYIKNSIKDGSFVPSRNSRQLPNSNKSVFLSLIMDNAYAEPDREISIANPGASEVANEAECEENIDQVPNDSIKTAMQKDQDLMNLNNAIQASIDKDKELIKSKILARLPQCGKYFDTIDVPDLFYGSPPIEINGKFELPKPSDINSFLPNPTNSVLMNKTILLPESGNPIFDDYVEEELKRRKLVTDRIDTWDYAHVGSGNIHCSSHSIPHCQPRLSK